MNKIRPAEPADLDPLAQLWLKGWTEAHADHVPPELTAKRPLDSFRRRLEGYGTGFAQLVRWARLWECVS